MTKLCKYLNSNNSSTMRWFNILIIPFLPDFNSPTYICDQRITNDMMVLLNSQLLNKNLQLGCWHRMCTKIKGSILTILKHLSYRTRLENIITRSTTKSTHTIFKYWSQVNMKNILKAIYIYINYLVLLWFRTFVMYRTKLQYWSYLFNIEI